MVDFSSISNNKINKGVESGFNIKEIVEAGTASFTQKVTDIEDKIKINTDKISQFTQFKSLLGALKDSANFLRTPPGILEQENDVFKSKKVGISSFSLASPANYASITADNSSNLIDFNLAIKQVAKAGTKISTASITSNSSALNITGGTYKIGLLNGKKSDIAIAATDSLDTIVSKINLTTDTSGVYAATIQVAPNDFKLRLYSNETGSSNDIDTSLSFFTATSAAINLANETIAQNAIIKIDNSIEITRSTNQISDVFDGVNINLLQPTPNYSNPTPDEIKVKLQQNTDAIIEKINNFLTAFADLKVFLARQEVKNVDGEVIKKDAILFGEILINSIKEELNRVTGFSPKFISSTVSLGSVGVRFDSLDVDLNDDKIIDKITNLLVINSENEQQVIDSIKNSPDNIKALFGFSFLPSNSALTNLDRKATTTLKEFSIQIDSVNDEAIIIPADGSTTFKASLNLLPNSTNTYLITGLEGTALEGASYGYTGPDTTITVKQEQGIADRLFNLLDQYNQVDGLVDDRNDSILDENTNNTYKKADAQTALARETERLYNKWSATEAAIARANSVQKQVRSIFGLDTKSN
jgi:flagellar capping protein FliD